MNEKYKAKYQKIKSKMRLFRVSFKRLPWGHISILVVCFTIALSVFLVLKANCFNNFDVVRTLSDLLTVNGVFSAILITYLFSRIAWSKERKLEAYKEAVSLSQKITDFRRILNVLTKYYKVWENDKATKSLIEHSKFKTIDFYEYKLFFNNKNQPNNKMLIEELRDHQDFEEGQSVLYLAMVSLVRNRKNPNKVWQEELYKDFEINGLYNIKVVEKWMKCGIFGTIWYWLDQKDQHYINYLAIDKDKPYILSLITKINRKYESQELNDKLLKEIADDFESHYLNELYLRLKNLRKGAADLNLLIIVLITVSLIFGVLLPFVMLLILSEGYWFSYMVAVIASINSALISYFILRFPTLIKTELKWI